MIYVFDSDAMIDLFRHFYPKRFPSLWEKFDQLVSDKTIVSAREVRKELDGAGDRLAEWTKNRPDFFLEPSNEELSFVTEIFKVEHFQSLVRQRERLLGKPVADPFVIAKAKLLGGWVITQELHKPNSSRIPNVCEHFDIPCSNLEGFMEMEGWTF